jgi:hypothetical protein
MQTRRTSTRLPTIKPEPPHGALGEIREFTPANKPHLRVPLPKAQRPSKPTQEKKRRSTRS